MATTKSPVITNIDTNVRNPAHTQGGYLKEACSSVVTSATESASNDLMVVPVPSNARVSQVLLTCDDASSTGAIDVGIWTRSTSTGTPVYTAVDDDLFASAIDLSGGPMKNLDVTYESDEYTPAESDKMLWEVLGLSVDPGIDYYIGCDITTVFSGGPTAVNIKVRYVQGP